MYRVGQEEIDALTRVIRSKALFRYDVGHACDRFGARYAEHLGVGRFALAASGSQALAAATLERADLRDAKPVDAQKYDLRLDA